MAIPHGRWTVDVEGDFVVFLIGFRVSLSLRSLRALPLLRTMPQMLADLERDPSKGLLGHHGSGVAGPIVQYWRSFEHLERFARSPDDRHAAVWRDWFRRAQHLNPAVGIWHETYTVRAGEYEGIYQGMAEGFGLMSAGTPRRLGGAERAATRMGTSESDLPAPGG